MWIGTASAKTLEGSANRAANLHKGVGWVCVLKSQRLIRKTNNGTSVTLFCASGTWVPKVCSTFGRSKQRF